VICVQPVGGVTADTPRAARKSIAKFPDVGVDVKDAVKLVGVPVACPPLVCTTESAIGL